MLRLRQHQIDISEIANRIIAGSRSDKSVTLDCVPGGGKTGAATLFANMLLDSGHIDSVLWVVPRLNLGEQVADAFARGPGCRDRRVLELVDGRDALFAPALPNMPNVVGCITTYQTITTKGNWRRFQDAVGSRKCLLILDEVQFLNDQEDRGWYPKMLAVRNAATYDLLMSGTLWRTDGKRIPFIRYTRGDGSEERPNQGLFYPCWDVRYTYQQAIFEQAILQTEWRNRNAIVEYVYNGEDHIHELSGECSEEESRMIRAFLSSEKACQRLLDDMVEDWRQFCRDIYHSRMIVMAQDIRDAKRWRDYLQNVHNIPCVLATSREEAGGRKLRHFRERRHGQCLVTVAMAYVGFDCPDLTHLTYLSNARAPSWLLQSFARVSRFDPMATKPYSVQHAFIYAPDDPPLREFFRWLREQQAKGVTMRERRAGEFGNRPEPAVVLPDDFEPVAAETCGQAVESIHGRLNEETVRRLDEFVAACPSAASLPRSQLFEILKAAGNDLSSPLAGVPS